MNYSESDRYIVASHGDIGFSKSHYVFRPLFLVMFESGVSVLLKNRQVQVG